MDRLHFFVLILTTFWNLQLVEMEKRVHVQRIKQCDGKDNLAVFLPEMQIKQIKKGEFVVNGKIEVREQINEMKGYAELNNCKDSLMNKCYKYFNMTFNICDAMADAADFLQQVSPTLKCPLKKITYEVTDLPVKNDLIAYMPTLGQTSYWSINIAGFHKNKMIACMNVQLQIAISRRG